MTSQKKLNEIAKKLEAGNKIKDQIKDKDFDWELIFPKEEKRIHVAWLILSVISYFIITGMMVFYLSKGEKAYTYAFVIGAMICIWLASCTHLRFRKPLITTMVSLSSIILFGVSAGITSPEDALDEMKDVAKIEQNAPAQSKTNKSIKQD
jgi:hypothetical protein